MTGWQPRLPLTVAEQHVDFPSHSSHIVDRRHAVEREASSTVKRLGVLLDAYQGVTPQALLNQIQARLERALDHTALFGYTEAQREVRALRATRPARAAYQVPDAGQYAQDAAQGLAGVRGLIRRRSRELAHKIADEANKAAAIPGLTPETRTIEIRRAAQRALHNGVLELVGETLNMGRTAGVLALTDPPEFAMRSEQLDENTCEECDAVHGEIVEIGTGEYYDLLPPSRCLGGGRCRGVMVYGDGPVDLRQPDLLEAA